MMCDMRDFAVACAGAVLVAGVLVGSGCVSSEGGHEIGHEGGAGPPALANVPDTRESLLLSPKAGREHRAVMQQHLESVQVVVAALGREDFELAQKLTEAHLGFFMHRQAMQRQRPEDFPPAYHDLAMAHHQAAEDLARIIPSRDLKQIMPRLNGVLETCVACHLTFKVKDSGKEGP